MRQTWRWFGPADTVSVDDMLQAGVEGVVTALHFLKPGEIWTRDQIAQRQDELSRMSDGAPSGLAWEVVESIPISEDIKKQKGNWREHVANYKSSLRNVAAAGIEVVCYNIMPVLDWTRTELNWRLPNGGTCMRFDITDFAAFDIHILKRAGAAQDYPEDIAAEAGRRYRMMDENGQRQLTANIVSGLPGAADHFTLDDVRAHLAEYDGIDAEKLRSHFIAFLEHVIPEAERLGLRMCCHPDDPPFSLLGLPRIMSTRDDYRRVLDAVASPANGMTLCSGSLGARPDNDLPALMDEFGPRVPFIHLRNVTRESTAVRGSFYEAEHLGGGTDMVTLIAAILREEKRRKKEGRADSSIPFRPDHGQSILDDLKRKTQPGYPAIGRLKGLAELRGVMTALSRSI